MMETSYILDLGGISKYGALSLHIEDKDLDPYAYRLLGHYRAVVTEKREALVIETTEETAAGCKMSCDKVRKARLALAELHYIVLEIADGKRIGVALIDKLPEAVARTNDSIAAPTPPVFATPLDSATPPEIDRGYVETPPEIDSPPEIDRGFSRAPHMCAGALGVYAGAALSNTIPIQESCMDPESITQRSPFPVESQQQVLHLHSDRNEEEREFEGSGSERGIGWVSEEASDRSADRVSRVTATLADRPAAPTPDPAPPLPQKRHRTRRLRHLPAQCSSIADSEQPAAVSQTPDPPHASTPKSTRRKPQSAARSEVDPTSRKPRPPKPPPYHDERNFVEAKYYAVDPALKVIYSKTYTPRMLGEVISDAQGIEAPRRAQMERKGIEIVRGSVLNRTPDYADFVLKAPSTTAAERIPLLDAFAEIAFKQPVGFNYETLNGNRVRIDMLVSALAEHLGKTRAQAQSSAKLARQVRFVYAKAQRDAKVSNPRSQFIAPNHWESFSVIWEQYADRFVDEDETTKPRYNSAGDYWEYYNPETRGWEKQDDELRRQEREAFQKQRYALVNGGARQRSDGAGGDRGAAV